MLPGEVEMVFNWTDLPEKWSVKQPFVQSWGLDTALYKNLPLTFMCYPITGLEQCWCRALQWHHELRDAVEQSGCSGVAASVCDSDLYPPDVEGAGEQRQRGDVVQHWHRWEVSHQCRQHARVWRRRPNAWNNIQVSRTRCHSPGVIGDKSQ